ncbi:flagellar export protein FliJ [Caldimonas taiwanensis]|uniref:flagellar export protein FliJ n=1 Tax=Caldimonas taiwanensis TaxID=307483 RepID=UPI000A004560|nr:flagellar export protein FliJ [Caldimonas taiwanensis]
MHPRLHPLTLALEVAEKECQQAHQVVLRLQHQMDAARAQARQLDDYRRDYQQRWSERFRIEGTAPILQCYQDFMARLDQASTQQQATVQRLQHHLEQAQQSLRERETRAASIRKLIERRQGELALARQRQEQKLTDEQAARMAWSRGAADSGDLALA